MIINDIINKIKESEKIAITFHTSPDGDSLGSSLALMQGLLQMGKKAYIVSKESLPETFNYLPYNEKVDISVNSISKDTDTVIVVDCGNVERINGNLDIQNKSYTLINIDHHLSNDFYGDFNYVDSKASAAAEIIYELLKMLGVTIDEDIAICLYTSLITDTGSFRHSNTTNLTHKIAGELIDTGIDFSNIHRKIFENNKFNRVKLQGEVINNMYLILNEKVCIMELTLDMLNKYNMEKGDTSDIVNIGSRIGSIEVSILFKEAESGTKISLRSKNIVDVRKVAEKFGGGGHVRAAGCFVDKSIEETKELLIKELEKELI